MNNKFVRESPILPLSEIYPQLKSQIESRKKIQNQIKIERNREYVDKMTKQKNSINITPDDELLALIDQEASQDLRTRKAQVLYIIREHFNRQEKKLKEIEKIREETEDFKNPWNKIKLLENNNKTKPEEK